MKIELSAKAISNLRKLSNSEKKKIFKKLHLLENSPLEGKKLTGEFIGLFSLKAWPYRIIYQFLRIKKKVYIVTIEHRQGAYR
jgi:mRNA-degrading endonuclease RelE of RelBE toxin-antitoxin system